MKQKKKKKIGAFFFKLGYFHFPEDSGSVQQKNKLDSTSI